MLLGGGCSQSRRQQTASGTKHSHLSGGISHTIIICIYYIITVHSITTIHQFSSVVDESRPSLPLAVWIGLSRSASVALLFVSLLRPVSAKETDCRVQQSCSLEPHAQAMRNARIWVKTLVIRQPRLQQGERVRGEITSSKGQEVFTSSKGQEARSKRSRSNYKQQGARSKKSGSNKK